MGEAGSLGGRGHRRGFRAADLPTCRWSTKAYSISDAESFGAARELLRKEGILGRLVLRHAARRGAALLPRADRRRSASSPSSATAATSTCRRCSTTTGWPSRACSSASSTATCATSSRAAIARAARVVRRRRTTRCSPPIGRMRAADVSQLPVLDGGQLVGIVDESDLLARSSTPTSHGERVPRRRSASAMVDAARRPSAADAPLDELLPVFDRGHVAIVIDGDEFLGLDHPHRPAQPFAGARRDEPHDSNQLAFATRCIHAGQEPDPTTGAVMMPIYATSTYVQAEPGVHKGYEYARTQNPTRMRLRALHRRPRGRHAPASPSPPGWRRSRTVLELLDAGAHVVATDDLYGGTLPAVRARAPALGRARLHLRRPDRPRRGRGGDQARRRSMRLGRDADQSAAEARRPRGDRRRSRRRSAA